MGKPPAREEENVLKFIEGEEQRLKSRGRWRVSEFDSLEMLPQRGG